MNSTVVSVAQFAILGMATGALYGVVGLGAVVVYRVSGVLNFAGGAIGAFGAFSYYELRGPHGIPVALALPAALGIGVVLGLATWWLVMQLLRNASRVVQLVATLGVMSLVLGVTQVSFGTEPRRVQGDLPRVPWRLGDEITISSDRVILIFGVTAIAVCMAVFASRTRFGLATAAVAENRRAAAGLGWSTLAIERWNFAIAGALYAIAGILIAPIIGLNSTTLTLTIVPGLAAALLGSFSSYGLTLVGAMIIGIANAQLVRFVDTPGVGESVPFLVIILVTVFGGKARPARGDLADQLPAAGSGRISGRVLLAGLGGGVLWMLIGNQSWLDALTTTLLTAMVVLSVVVVTGFAGQLSLAQVALAGFGAWVAGQLASELGLSFPVAVAVGVAATVPAGVMVALPALRTRGVNLAVATLALSLVVESLILNNYELTGGIDGTQVEPPQILGVDVDAVEHPSRYAFLVLLALGVVGCVVANLRRSALGRSMLAMRGNERAAAASGVNVHMVKLGAFGIASAIAALAGALTAFRSTTIVYSNFDVFGSIAAVQYAVIGGLGWASGAVLGALYAPGGILSRVLDAVADPGDWLPVLAGLTVIVVLAFAPRGLAERATEIALRRRPSRQRDEDEVPATGELGPLRRVVPKELAVRGISVRFGAAEVLADIDLRVEPGTVHGLIGPNGAGKTTLLDVLSGLTRPESGGVLLGGYDVTQRSPHRRANGGIGRSFQAVELFEDLTVEENLMVATERNGARQHARDLVWPRAPQLVPDMRALAAQLGLTAELHLRPSELSHGRARLVGIARAVASGPSVLLLDEPAAGLDPTERAALVRVIRHLSEDRGLGVVLVEHDVGLVLEASDLVTVLVEGCLLMTGSPSDVAGHPRVQAAYLGTTLTVSNEVRS